MEWCPIECLKHILEVNTVGPVRVTQAFLPLLRNTRGRVVFVTSVAGTWIIIFRQMNEFEQFNRPSRGAEYDGLFHVEIRQCRFHRRSAKRTEQVVRYSSLGRTSALQVITGKTLAETFCQMTVFETGPT